MEGFASITAATQEADNEDELIVTCKELWRSAEREIATQEKTGVTATSNGRSQPLLFRPNCK